MIALPRIIFLILELLTFIQFIVPLKKAQVKSEWLSWQGCIDFHIANDLLQLKPQVVLESESDNYAAGLIFKRSIDLGYSEDTIILNKEGLCLPKDKNDESSQNVLSSETIIGNKSGLSSIKTNDDYKLLATWDELEAIQKKKSGCYSIYDDGSKPFHITTLSETTGIPASLYPPLQSTGAPTIILGGFTMHRIVGDTMNPYVDTINKLESIPIFKGAKVLDTCCGLGYTAITAAKRVTGVGLTNNRPTGPVKSSLKQNAKEIIQKPNTGKVTTIEYDDASLEMCAHNPWSKSLFDNSLPIDVLQGDSCEIVKQFRDKSFNIVIHDPPARNLCRTDLHRVLTTNGLLYHYIGNPESKESGRLYSGIIARLKSAGFQNIKKVNKAFGVVASVGYGNSNSFSSNSNSHARLLSRSSELLTNPDDYDSFADDF